MKIGVFLSDEMQPSIGGNFSYHQKFIDAIDHRNFDQRVEICFVARAQNAGKGWTKPFTKVAPRFLYRMFRPVDKSGLTRLFRVRFNLRINLAEWWDHRALKAAKIDLLLYPKQFLKEVEDFPFITMNWDAGHKTTFAFPELLLNFESREDWYLFQIQKALAIFVESQSSKSEFTSFYAVPEKKIFVVPLFAGGVVDLKVDDTRQQETLTRLKLQRQGYFYYPAQFWAHKNHYNLILAFKLFRTAHPGTNIKLVFSGSDQGNKDYVRQVIRENKLDDAVIMLGFVTNEEVYTLYTNALALTMATFLGPTNMPLLEAQMLHTPVICSDMEGHRESCEDGALYADPADPAGWENAMTQVMDPSFRTALIQKADAVCKRSEFNIETAIRKLEAGLIAQIPVRKTFG